MELNTGKADGLRCGTPEAPGAKDSFSAEYFKACKRLLDTKPQEFDGDWDENDLREVAAFMSRRMEEARQKVCTHMTDWLYEHRGEVGQWPHTDSGVCLACRDKDGVGGILKATFSYFGWDVSRLVENGRMRMEATWPRKRDFPYAAEAPVMPQQSRTIVGNRAGEKREVSSSRVEEFRQYYDMARAKAAEALKEAEKALEAARGQKDFSPAEEQAVKEAKEEVKLARKRQKLPFLEKIFFFLVLFTIPGYIFAGMGGMPEELYTSMYEMVESNQWYSWLVMLPWILWQVPGFAVQLIEVMGGKGLVWRFVALAVLAAVEILGGLVGLAFLYEGSKADAFSYRSWWRELIATPGNVRRAKKRLREAKRAYRATTEAYRENARKSNEASAKQRIRELEQQVERLRMEKLDSVNMKKWHERFNAFKRGEEYREARWLDEKGKESRRKEQAAYEAAMKKYEEACGSYEEKKKLCALWQDAWYRYLSKEEIPADLSDSG